MVTASPFRESSQMEVLHSSWALLKTIWLLVYASCFRATGCVLWLMQEAWASMKKSSNLGSLNYSSSSKSILKVNRSFAAVFMFNGRKMANIWQLLLACKCFNYLPEHMTFRGLLLWLSSIEYYPAEFCFPHEVIAHIFCLNLHSNSDGDWNTKANSTFGYNLKMWAAPLLSFLLNCKQGPKYAWITLISALITLTKISMGMKCLVE